MTWAAVAVAVVGAASGAASASKQRKASKKSAAAQRAAIAQGYDVAEDRLGIYSQFGRNALKNLGRLTGNTAFLGSYLTPEAEELAQLKAELEGGVGPSAPGKKDLGLANYLDKDPVGSALDPGSRSRKKKAKKAKAAYQQQLAEYEADKEKKTARIAELETIVSQQKAQEDAAPQTTGADYLKELPGYQFRFAEGERAVGANQSKRNMALSGAALKELTMYGQGFASTEYDKEFNRLMSMAGLGQSADTGLANLASGFGAANAAIAQGQGQDQATTYASYNNAVQSGLKNYQYQQRTNAQGQAAVNPNTAYSNNQYGPTGDFDTGGLDNPYGV